MSSSLRQQVEDYPLHYGVGSHVILSGCRVVLLSMPNPSSRVRQDLGKEWGEGAMKGAKAGKDREIDIGSKRVERFGGMCRDKPSIGGIDIKREFETVRGLWKEESLFL
jgi:hypothetical protein